MNINIFFENVLKLLNKIANKKTVSVPSNLATKEDVDAIKAVVDRIEVKVDAISNKPEL